MMGIKNWIIKNKLQVGLGFITLLILIANFDPVLWLFPAIAIVFIFVTYNFKQLICSITYLVVFSGISPIFATAIVWCFVLCYVRYFIDVKNRQKPFHKLPFFYTLVFVLVFSLIIDKTDTRGVFNLILSICLPFFAYLIFIYSKEIDIKQCFNSLFVSVVVSAILGCGLCWIDSIKSIIYPFDGTYHRLRLFSLNVNQLAGFAMFGISFVVYDIFNNYIFDDLSFLKNKLFWLEIIKIVVYAVIGLLTMSKAFLVMLAIILLYFIVMLAVKLKSKSLMFIIPFILLALFCLLVFKNFIKDIYSRFFVYNQWDSWLSKIFTGRTDIWKEYLKYLTGSVFRLLFGVGFVSADIISVGPHSIYIYLLYRIGIVGILALGGLFYIYAKKANTKVRITIYNILPIFMFLVFGLEEMILSDRFFLFLVFAILLTCSPKEKDIKNNK